MVTAGLSTVPVQRPILVDNLPGGMLEVESFWAFMSLLMSLCTEQVLMTFVTGDLLHRSSFELAEQVLCGAFNTLDTFKTFYYAVGQLSILYFLSGMMVPAASTCSFSSTKEVLQDPSAAYILKVLIQFVRLSLTR